MEGVGARLGRSSARFQPAAVFTGPVRKWTKKWVPLPNPTNPKSTRTTAASNNASHLFLFKWTPISSTQTNGSTAAAPAGPTDQPKRKFRYVPVSVIEGQKQNADENSDTEAGSSPQATQDDDSNKKSEPDDDQMEDSQAANKGSEVEAAEEGNVANLDLNLN